MLCSSPRPRRCKVCREQYVPHRPLQRVCCGACALTLAKSDRAKAEKRQQVKDRAETRKRKEAIKPRRELLAEAQRAFNAYIRARDRSAGHSCISSGRPLDWSGNSVDAGHFRSVGSAPHLRFHEINCHAQSKQDNRYGSGCAVEYRKGLIARIGLEAVEALEADQTQRKYTADDLREIKRLYTAKLRDLSREQG